MKTFASFALFLAICCLVIFGVSLTAHAEYYSEGPPISFSVNPHLVFAVNVLLKVQGESPVEISYSGDYRSEFQVETLIHGKPPIPRKAYESFSATWNITPEGVVIRYKGDSSVNITAVSETPFTIIVDMELSKLSLILSAIFVALAFVCSLLSERNIARLRQKIYMVRNRIKAKRGMSEY